MLESYMIVFSKNSKRLENFEINKKKIPSLILFEASDSINKYEEVKKEALSKNFCSKKFIKEIDSHKRTGKLGCNISYIKLFKKILKRKPEERDWFLILEDDVDINGDIEVFLKKSIDDLSSLENDYIRLYIDPRFKDIQFSKDLHIKNDIYKMAGGDGSNQWYTLAQLVSGRGVRKILSKLPINEPIDIFVNKEKKPLKAAAIKNQIFTNLGAITRDDKSSKLGSLIWFNK